VAEHDANSNDVIDKAIDVSLRRWGRTSSDGASGSAWTRWGRLPAPTCFASIVLPDFERADQIGAYCEPKDPHFAELLVDCEEDRTLRAVLVGMLREAERARWALYRRSAAMSAMAVKITPLRRIASHHALTRELTKTIVWSLILRPPRTAAI
jgi:hypothetical protein